MGLGVREIHPDEPVFVVAPIVRGVLVLGHAAVALSRTAAAALDWNPPAAPGSRSGKMDASGRGWEREADAAGRRSEEEVTAATRVRRRRKARAIGSRCKQDAGP